MIKALCLYNLIQSSKPNLIVLHFLCYWGKNISEHQLSYIL